MTSPNRSETDARFVSFIFRSYARVINRHERIRLRFFHIKNNHRKEDHQGLISSACSQLSPGLQAGRDSHLAGTLGRAHGVYYGL